MIFVTDEIRSLLRTLVQFHHDRQGEELQRQYDSFLALIDKSIPQIWLDEDASQEFKPVSLNRFAFVMLISWLIIWQTLRDK